MTVETVQIPVYRPFAVQVARLQRLSPSFLRVTFTGADLDEFAPNGFDQRIKVLLPLPGRGIDDCPSDPDWYGEWRALPADRADADPHLHDPRRAAASCARWTSTSSCTARPGPRRRGRSRPPSATRSS